MPSLDEYWKHKLDQLWKEVEDLKRRVSELESNPSQQHTAPISSEKMSQSTGGLVPVRVQTDSRIMPPAPVIKKTEFEDPVIAILKERGAMNIIDLNNALKEKGINEGVRETLFNRVKPLLKKGSVGYDEATQMFSIS